ncbi:MAG TPA: hypothetical protein VK308_14580 [Pyrinomonadaceae bacterium]|nr:hypothetical protein [Pyrinomonadaceae bacterium]
MKNVHQLPSGAADQAGHLKRSNVRLFPTGKILDRQAPRKVSDRYRPQSLSDGIRVFVVAEFRESPFKMIASFIALLLIFFWLFIGVPAIFG